MMWERVSVGMEGCWWGWEGVGGDGRVSWGWEGVVGMGLTVAILQGKIVIPGAGRMRVTFDQTYVFQFVV